MLACATERGISKLEFTDTKHIQDDLNTLSKCYQTKIIHQLNDDLIALQQQLKEYFDGSRKEFTIPLDVTGTEFQIKAWQYLQTITFGHTITYSDQARDLNKELAIRALAHANGCNKIAILIPCHRVLGKNGKLTGYRWGLNRKRKLILHEQQFSELKSTLFSE